MIFPQTPPANVDWGWNRLNEGGGFQNQVPQRWHRKALRESVGFPEGFCLIASFGDGGQRGFPAMVLDFCAMIDYNDIKRGR